MIIQSDWHIHSESSYDAVIPLEEIATNAKKFGFKKVGITDHLNLNDHKFLGDLKNSAESVTEFQKNHPEVVLGVELNPIQKPEFDYIAKHGTNEGYVPPVMDKLYDIELALTKEELMGYGVRYAVGAAHWRIECPGAKEDLLNFDACVKEWHRQQMWLAQDERVTILGHPWYHGRAIWYEDFSVIPRSMHMELAAALKENKKYVECNSGILCSPKTTEKFRMQYAEFLRELFEMGIPVTYGSDSHKEYIDKHTETEKYLSAAGFKSGEFAEIKEEDFWF